RTQTHWTTFPAQIKAKHQAPNSKGRILALPPTRIGAGLLRRLGVCCFAEWYSAGGRIANPRHSRLPVCATVAVPRCAQLQAPGKPQAWKLQVRPLSLEA